MNLNYYSLSSSKKKTDDYKSLEDEFDQLIEAKIRVDHNITLTATKFNDDLYDPNKDDEDEEFINDLNVSNKFTDSKESKSDATLNCPCCTSLLCLGVMMKFFIILNLILIVLILIKILIFFRLSTARYLQKSIQSDVHFQLQDR